MNEAATHEDERSCLLDAACSYLLEATQEADIRKATDALAKLDGELRRKHPVTSKPRREMIDELVALGFEENVALKACRVTDNGALEARVAFCLEQAGKETPPEADDSGDASCARRAAAFYLATCADRDVKLKELCAASRRMLAERQKDAEEALTLQRALAPGLYEDATIYPYNNNNPGMDFNENGSGYGRRVGKFKVHEIKYQGDELSALALDFIFDRDGKSPNPVFGKIRYNSHFK